MKMQINPAILVSDFKELQRQVSALENEVSEFDIDIIDWQRHDLKTLPAGEALLVQCRKPLNFDLMLERPKADVERLVREPRVRRIILNTECLDDIDYLLNLIHFHGKQAGLSLTPERNFYEFQDIINEFDLIQLFTIEPGAQGNPFLAEELQRTRVLKDSGYKGLIEIDGGVNPETADLIINYPIDIVSVGSALSRAEDPVIAFRKLREALQT